METVLTAMLHHKVVRQVGRSLVRAQMEKMVTKPAQPTELGGLVLATPTLPLVLPTPQSLVHAQMERAAVELARPAGNGTLVCVRLVPLGRHSLVFVGVEKVARRPAKQQELGGLVRVRVHVLLVRPKSVRVRQAPKVRRLVTKKGPLGWSASVLLRMSPLLRESHQKKD